MATINFSELYRRTNAPFAIDKTNVVTNRGRLYRPCGVGSIEYVIHGQGVVTENNHTFRVKAGDVFILHTNNYHDYGGDPKDPWTRVWVQVSGWLAPQVLGAYGLSQINHIPDFDLKEDLLQITKIINKDTDIETIDAVGPVLLLKLVQKIHKELCKRGMIVRETTAAEQIRNAIDGVPDGNITIEQLCMEFHFSERHLNRIFHEQYGITPKKYILNRKIGIIQSLLKRTDLSIKEIAERLHFCNAAYLSRFFCEQTGIRPLDYRKKNQ